MALFDYRGRQVDSDYSGENPRQALGQAMLGGVKSIYARKKEEPKPEVTSKQDNIKGILSQLSSIFKTESLESELAKIQSHLEQIARTHSSQTQVTKEQDKKEYNKLGFIEKLYKASQSRNSIRVTLNKFDQRAQRALVSAISAVMKDMGMDGRIATSGGGGRRGRGGGWSNFSNDDYDNAFSGDNSEINKLVAFEAERMKQEAAIQAMFAALNAGLAATMSIFSYRVVKSFDQIKTDFFEMIQGAINFRVEMKEILHGTTLVGERTDELIDSQSTLKKMISRTGKDEFVLQKLVAKEAQKGYRLNLKELSLEKARTKEMKGFQDSITSSLSTAAQLGMNAEETASFFSKMRRETGFTTAQTGQLGRDLKTISQLTGVYGTNLQNAVQSAESLIKSLRNAGSLTSDSTKTMIAGMAAAQKYGVADVIEPILKATTSMKTWMETPFDEQKILLQAYGGDRKEVRKLIMGGQLKTPEGLKDFGTKLETRSNDILKTLFARNKEGGSYNADTNEITKDGRTLKVTMENFTELMQMLPETANTVNKAFHNIFGREVGEIFLGAKALKEAGMSPTERIAEIEAQRKKYNDAKILTPGKEKQFNEQIQELQTQDFFTKMNRTLENQKGNNFEGALKAGGFGDQAGLQKSISEGLDPFLASVQKQIPNAFSEIGFTPEQLKNMISSGNETQMRAAQEALGQLNEKLGIKNQADLDPVKSIELMMKKLMSLLQEHLSPWLGSWEGTFGTYIGSIISELAKIGITLWGFGKLLGITAKGGSWLGKIFGAGKTATDAATGAGKTASNAAKGGSWLGKIFGAGKTATDAATGAGKTASNAAKGGSWLGKIFGAGKTATDAATGAGKTASNAAKGGSWLGKIFGAGKTATDAATDAGKTATDTAKGGWIGKLGKFSKLGKFLGKSLPYIGTVLSAVDGAMSAKDEGKSTLEGATFGALTGNAGTGSNLGQATGLTEKGTITDQILGVIEAGVTGAIGGAAVGSAFAGVGAIPGAIIGAIAGLGGKTINNTLETSRTKQDMSSKSIDVDAAFANRKEEINKITDDKSKLEELKFQLESEKNKFSGSKRMEIDAQKDIEENSGWLGGWFGEKKEAETRLKDAQLTTQQYDKHIKELETQVQQLEKSLLEKEKAKSPANPENTGLFDPESGKEAIAKANEGLVKEGEESKEGLTSPKTWQDVLTEYLPKIESRLMELASVFEGQDYATEIKNQNLGIFDKENVKNAINPSTETSSLTTMEDRIFKDYEDIKKYFTSKANPQNLGVFDKENINNAFGSQMNYEEMIYKVPPQDMISKANPQNLGVFDKENINNAFGSQMNYEEMIYKVPPQDMISKANPQNLGVFDKENVKNAFGSQMNYEMYGLTTEELKNINEVLKSIGENKTKEERNITSKNQGIFEKDLAKSGLSVDIANFDKLVKITEDNSQKVRDSFYVGDKDRDKTVAFTKLIEGTNASNREIIDAIIGDMTGVDSKGQINTKSIPGVDLEENILRERETVTNVKGSAATANLETLQEYFLTTQKELLMDIRDSMSAVEDALTAKSIPVGNTPFMNKGNNKPLPFRQNSPDFAEYAYSQSVGNTYKNPVVGTT